MRQTDSDRTKAWKLVDTQKFLLRQRRNRVWGVAQLNTGFDAEEFAKDYDRVVASLQTDIRFTMEETFVRDMPKVKPRNDREKELFVQAVRKLEDSGSNNIFFDCNTSQMRSNGNGPESALDVTTCVRPTHQIYSVRLARYLLPEEHLAVQGIWEVDAENKNAWKDLVADGKLAMDVAGNSFSSTVAQTVMLSSLVTCQAWHRVRHESSTESAILPSCQGNEDSAAGSSKDIARHEGKKHVLKRLRQKSSLHGGFVVVAKKNGAGKGNKHARGKRPSATIVQKEAIMKAYDELKDKGKKHARKILSSMPGYFRSCTAESKWGRQRREQMWPLLVQTAPALLKKCKEVPNSLRVVMQWDNLKHNIHTAKNDVQIHLPVPLQNVVEEMVMTRIGLGEEMNFHYVKNVIVFATELWNSVVGPMSEQLQSIVLAQLKERDEEFALLAASDLDTKMNAMIASVQGFLKPIKLADNDTTILQRGCMMNKQLFVYIYMYHMYIYTFHYIYIYTFLCLYKYICFYIYIYVFMFYFLYIYIYRETTYIYT